jgi:hypothetical protein
MAVVGKLPLCVGLFYVLVLIFIPKQYTRGNTLCQSG